MDVREYLTASGTARSRIGWAGVFELRVDVGPGYRIYVDQDGPTLLLLLCGGDKRTQAQDIEVAHDYWKDYKDRIRQHALPCRGSSGGRGHSRVPRRRLA